MTATLGHYTPMHEAASSSVTTGTTDDREDEASRAVAVFAGQLATEPNYVPERVEGLPASLVNAYASLAVHHAQVEEIEPGVWFAQVAGLEGAWGDGDTPADALRELHEAIVGWVAIKRRFGVPVPTFEGFDLNDPARA